MDLERIRAVCMSFPHATEEILWGDDLVFKVGGKMFAVASLADGHPTLAFKCSPEEFALLTEIEGIIPAPYLARAHWVRLAEFAILSPSEAAHRLRQSYDLVFAGLARKVRLGLT